MEATLTGRDPLKKKLAGAVDLHNTMEGHDDDDDEDDARNNKPKRSVSFRDVSYLNISLQITGIFFVNSFVCSHTGIV